ncbi:hypothetical protein FE633_30870 [Streptomyces montanus]|uniref:Uncharacterized protein n=1 Tax=Streptomyces montanus TaxID=2580423 RepID=A0A5R9FJZ7_9ACTN|nr:hypothetical protein [Streptomyces montanus]TLS42390.1 hypothetical protein FE633_30870 [Streptomyces montanus]
MNAGGVALVGAIAAVLGAAVGAGGAVLSAALTGRLQASSQEAHWRRQLKREAYVNFLSQAASAIDALDAARLRTAEQGARLDEIAQEVRSVNRLVLVAYMEAPEPQVIDLFNRLNAQLSMWCGDLRMHTNDDPVVTAAVAARADALRGGAYRLLVEATSAAASELSTSLNLASATSSSPA